MDIQTQQLFSMALGLALPWTITEIKFFGTDQQLDILIDFNLGSPFLCPDCNKPGCKVHDTEERTWRHLDFFQHKTVLHARQPRVKCSKHGVKTTTVPWARRGSGFTQLMESYIVLLVQNGMTAHQVWNTNWRA
ncbi:transposase family protein [Desulfoluna spongiiphila]|uniref:transposase family protein n=1 Tax=Desulfoluna spongiiphila TaxID=419481 RepID=UPI001C3142D6|nr:transposase family protein [Desulfoluna spongiiphila]